MERDSIQPLKKQWRIISKEKWIFISKLRCWKEPLICVQIGTLKQPSTWSIVNIKDTSHIHKFTVSWVPMDTMHLIKNWLLLSEELIPVEMELLIMVNSVLLLNQSSSRISTSKKLKIKETTSERTTETSKKQTLNHSWSVDQLQLCNQCRWTILSTWTSSCTIMFKQWNKWDHQIEELLETTPCTKRIQSMDLLLERVRVEELIMHHHLEKVRCNNPCTHKELVEWEMSLEIIQEDHQWQTWQMSMVDPSIKEAKCKDTVTSTQKMKRTWLKYYLKWSCKKPNSKNINKIWSSNQISI